MYPASSEGEFPVWHVHSACSWGSLPLAVPAGLCLYSWAPAWTIIPKAKQGKHLLLCSLSWLRDRLRFVCPITDHVGNSWDWRVLRQNTAYLKALQCSHLPLLAGSTETCPYLGLGSSHHTGIFLLAQGLNLLSGRESSRRLCASCWLCGHESLKWAGWCVNTIGKATASHISSPFRRSRVFSWADPIHEGHCLSRQARQERYLGVETNTASVQHLGCLFSLRLDAVANRAACSGSSRSA